MIGLGKSVFVALTLWAVGQGPEPEGIPIDPRDGLRIIEAPVPAPQQTAAPQQPATQQTAVPPSAGGVPADAGAPPAAIQPPAPAPVPQPPPEEAIPPPPPSASATAARAATTSELWSRNQPGPDGVAPGLPVFSPVVEPPVPGAPAGSAEPPRGKDDEPERGRITYMPVVNSPFDEKDLIDWHPADSSFDYHDRIDYHPVP